MAKIENPLIAVVGTFDTKTDELQYLAEKIQVAGGIPITIDVSVLGETSFHPKFSKHDVASSAGSAIDKITNADDENIAMQLMAKGAAKLIKELHTKKEINGFIALGGTMGTDLALECASSLPLGFPKYIVSTVAFSPLIPPDRMPADIQMILWAGGLYGLNDICKSSLSQAAGSIVGSASIVEKPDFKKPLVGMTSLGKSTLSYMVHLKPELEKRGFDTAVFHSTGMGGRAFENLASENKFSLVIDFCLQEFTNYVHGSIVNSGKDRLVNAGKNAIPQIVAPGASDLVDIQSWGEKPARFKGREYHAHNRLIGSFSLSKRDREKTAKDIAKTLAKAKGRTHVLIPKQGIQEWDRKGEALHDPEGLSHFCKTLKREISDPVTFDELDCHINDKAFSTKALEIVDEWIKKGVIKF